MDTVSFADLGLPYRLVRALQKAGINDPFPIQTATIPDVLAGRDVLGRGSTGSGKTLAFGLPTITKLADKPASPHKPRAIVLVPTRELALQVNDALATIGQATGVKVRPIVGGMSMSTQVNALRRGLDLVVATPGRLSDHVRQGTCDLSEIEITILDEADQMADMGFLPQVREILDLTPAGSQRLLFSATLDRDVDALVRQYMTDAVTHALAPTTASVSTMEHHLLRVGPGDKWTVTAEIAGREARTLFFVRTKLGADRLVEQLADAHVRAGALHGGLSQAARNRALSAFREGTVPVLVATDVAARGVHVDKVDLVVHVDPPDDPKSYLHRAGRTARAGESGSVITLVIPRQERAVRRLAKDAGISPTWTTVKPGSAELALLTAVTEPLVITPAPAKRAGRSDSGSGRRSERGDRPARRFDRPDRPARTGGDRPSYNDRPARTGGDRPSYNDRPARTGGDRPDRAGGSDRPARGDRTDRPAYNDRPARTGGDRPAYNDRPARAGGTDRPKRSDRPARHDRPYRTDRGDQSKRPDWRPSTNDSNRRTYGQRLADNRAGR